MVCLSITDQPTAMSTARAREVVSTCNRGQARMQAIADLLLLTSDSRPVTTESLSFFGESYPKCRDTIITRTKGLLVLTGKIHEQLHSVTAKWHDVCVCIQDICVLVVGLTECSAHAAYLVAVSKPHCVPAVSGIIDQYKISRANVEIDLCCKQVHQASCDELNPPLLVQICSDINRNLTILTESCKSASERTEDVSTQDQFKLCIKSFTSCASCLLSSIKCFKAHPTETHLQRCSAFCEPLRHSTQATVTFATEDQFIGKPAILTPESKEAKKAILGSCLSIVASCVQLCRTVRELAYDNTNATQRDRIGLCTDSISKASSQLASALLQHNVADSRQSPSQNSPTGGGLHNSAR